MTPRKKPNARPNVHPAQPAGAPGAAKVPAGGKSARPNKSQRPPAGRRKSQNNIMLRIYAFAAVLLLGAVWLIFNVLRGGAPPGQWSEAPAMQIDVNRSYQAALATAKGTIVIDLLPQAAPITVNNFVFLARQGYYDGVTFHRVLDGFMAQGGDPTGTGTGGPGYFIPSEVDSGLSFDTAGVVAMANSGVDRNGSQFFITFGPQPSLNGGYTIFGRVVSGMDVVNALTRRDPAANPNAPPGDTITTITIQES